MHGDAMTGALRARVQNGQSQARPIDESLADDTDAAVTRKRVLIAPDRAGWLVVVAQAASGSL